MRDASQNPSRAFKRRGAQSAEYQGDIGFGSHGGDVEQRGLKA